MEELKFNDHVEFLATKYNMEASYETIASGSYAHVLRVSSDCFKDFAVKIIDKSKKSDYVRRFLPREMRIWPKLKHANIIRLIDTIEYRDSVMFLTELAAGGDLLTRLKKEQYFPEKEAQFVARQLAEALNYLHRKHVVHRDIKCENILFDDVGNVKLADFGFSRVFRPSSTVATFCGSRAYVAPEILESRPYDAFLTDAWSYGVIVYIIVSGSMPYDESDMPKMVKKQIKHNVKFPDLDFELSKECKQFVYELLHPSTDKRLTIGRAITSPWLRTTPYKMRTVMAVREEVA